MESAIMKSASLRETKKNEKKQRIHEAAIRVFARNGFYGTTISQVAKEAQVADGTIYLYFANKDDLLLKIIDEITDRFIVEGLEIVSRETSPIDQLKALAILHLKNLGANEDLACIFQIELRHNARFMKIFSETKLRQYFRIIEKIIREAQEQGQIRKEIDSWMAAKILFGALDEMATNWVLKKRDYSLVDMAKPTLNILLNGFCSQQSQSK